METGLRRKRGRAALEEMWIDVLNVGDENIQRRQRADFIRKRRLGDDARRSRLLRTLAQNTMVFGMERLVDFLRSAIVAFNALRLMSLDAKKVFVLRFREKNPASVKKDNQDRRIF